MRNSNNILLALLLSTVSALAQFGGQGVAAGSWEPLAIRSKAGIVAQYAPGIQSTVTLNGAGVSQLADRTGNGYHLDQATALNQPLITRADNKGNLLVQSETFATTWSRTRINAFGAVDTGAAGAGSFANTARTTDPLGGNTADFIQEDGTAANTHLFIQANLVFSGGSFAFEVWAKPAGRTWVFLQSSLGGAVNCYFDIQNGVVGSASGTAAVGTIVETVGAWQKLRLTGSSAGITSGNVIIAPAEANGDITFDGDNTSGLFIWGASLRPAAWDSDYVVTVATPAIAGLAGRKTAYFDGTANYLKTSPFTLNQPTEIYRLCAPWTWTLNDSAFDGNSTGTGKLYQSATTPNIRFFAGTDGTELTPPSSGVWRVTSVVFDGNSSRISTNRGDFAVSPAGAGNMGGFTLSANGANTAFWNGQAADHILCNKTNLIQETRYLQWGLLKKAGVL